MLISLANGDPLMVEQKVGQGRVIFVTTGADRDWSDLPLKTAYLPMVQALANYLACGQRGSLDNGIDVGSLKEISLPPAFVGKTLREAGLADVAENGRRRARRHPAPAR